MQDSSRIKAQFKLISKHSTDYFPLSKRLILRMLTPVHQAFLSKLGERIGQQLELISRGSGSAAGFAQDIGDIGSTTIIPRDPEYGTHEPDLSFQHLKSLFTTVIIEVAHSQKRTSLRSLAEDYILGSDLEIRVVVGIDIEYSKSKRATFSVWRAKERGPQNDKAWVVEPTVENQVFRNDDGKPNLDKTVGLRLPLQEFASLETCRHFSNIDEDIFVSCDDLYQYLEAAEAFMETRKLAKPEPRPQLKKRRRTRTPEEQMDDEAHAQDTERVSKRQDLEGSSYKESSSESA